MVGTRTILEDNTLATNASSEERRKLIVFTEDRDTLDYLARRIGSLLGRPEAVKATTAGYAALSAVRSPRSSRITPPVQVLLATDAAGRV